MKILVIFTFLLLSPYISAAERSLWIYSGQGSDSLIIDKDNNKISMGDRAYEARFCDSSLIYCIESEAFSFAVPMHLKHGGKWKHKESNYKIIKRKNVNFNNHYVTTWLIEQIYGDEVVVFLYSQQLGLLGIYERGDKNKVIWAEGKSGFPKIE